MFKSINRFNVEILSYSASSSNPISNPDTLQDYAGKDKFSVGDALDISGIARSDKSLLVTFLFGFGAKTRRVNVGGVSGQSNDDEAQAVQFDTSSDTVTVPANNSSGGGVRFGPIPCAGAEWVKVVVSGDTTSNFRLRLTKRIG